MIRMNERIAETVFAPCCVSVATAAQSSRSEHVLYLSPLSNKPVSGLFCSSHEDFPDVAHLRICELTFPCITDDPQEKAHGHDSGEHQQQMTS